MFSQLNFAALTVVSVGGTEATGMYSFCQLMTASMPTFIGCNITGIRPTRDCFYANLGHIMTADGPTIGQIVS